MIPPKILYFFIITALASFIEIFKEGRLISKLAGRKLLIFIFLYTKVPRFTKLPPFKVLGSLYDITAGMCDIIATVAMCIFLATVQTSYRRLVCDCCTWPVSFLTYSLRWRTKSIVNYLLIFAINRGIFVALTQLAFFGTYIAAPTKSYW